MPEYINLLDLVNRSGSEMAIGLIEDAFGVAPELEQIPVRTQRGSTYKLTRRTTDPAGGFRDLNEGRLPETSDYVQEVKSLTIFDLRMSMDVMAPAIEDRSVGDILTDEATGAFRGGMRTIGRQFYYGASASAKGFAGIGTQIASSGDVDAGGGADGTSAWLIYPGFQGVHFVVSDLAPFAISEWTKQLIRESDGKEREVLWAGITALIGLNVGSAASVFRVKGVKASNSANYLTDARGAELVAKVPTERQNGLIWLMNRTSKRTLQVSRSSIGQQTANSRGQGAHAPLPTELEGIPIVTSDMIAVNETGLIA